MCARMYAPRVYALALIPTEGSPEDTLKHIYGLIWWSPVRIVSTEGSNLTVSQVKVGSERARSNQKIG